jgi:hypothetical protein
MKLRSAILKRSWVLPGEFGGATHTGTTAKLQTEARSSSQAAQDRRSPAQAIEI